MIEPTNNVAGADPSAKIAAQAGSDAAASAASDFQSFLQLLTAQLRNQDPLAPLDSTQFVQQLASFASVEQQIQTNEKLENLTTSLAGSQLEAAAPWIGKDVKVETSAARFSGDPLTFGVPETSLGDVQREFVVKNASGEDIYTAPIASGNATFSWDGKTTDGKVAAEGDYKVVVNFIADGAVAESKSPLAFARVNEARLTDTDVQLVLNNGAVIAPGEILAVRAVDEPASSTGG